MCWRHLSRAVFERAQISQVGIYPPSAFIILTFCRITDYRHRTGDAPLDGAGAVTPGDPEGVGRYRVECKTGICPSKTSTGSLTKLIQPEPPTHVSGRVRPCFVSLKPRSSAGLGFVHCLSGTLMPRDWQWSQLRCSRRGYLWACRRCSPGFDLSNSHEDPVRLFGLPTAP